MKIFTYYYPGFFNDTYRISGTEWDIVKNAKQRNNKHYQPRVPLNGYYDQVNLETCKSQIELAKKNGIDGFMICYYWDFENSTPIMNEPLECLMKTLENIDFEFNIMWVLRLPHQQLPINNGKYGRYDNHPWFKKRIQLFQNDQSFLNDIERITSHPNYRKDEYGKPIFQVYSVSELLDLHGKETKNIFNHFKNYHIQAVCGRSDHWIEESELLGLDSLTTYVTLVNFNSNKTILNHFDCVLDQPGIWENIQSRTKLPFFPSVASGWDASARGAHMNGFRIKKFPWSPVVIDSNPNDFEKNLFLAKDWCLEKKVDLHIASWNEWSEGHYIEPDEKFGYEFLEKVSGITKLKSIKPLYLK